MVKLYSYSKNRHKLQNEIHSKTILNTHYLYYTIYTKGCNIHYI